MGVQDSLESQDHARRTLRLTTKRQQKLAGANALGLHQPRFSARLG